MTKPTKLLTLVAFSKLAGVSKQAVSKSVLRGRLKEAMVNDRINSMHPNAVAYLKSNDKRRRADLKPEVSSNDTSSTDRAQTSNGNGVPRRDSLVTDTGLDISRYADMTLRELVERFGSVRALKDWLEALKKIEDIREKRLSNEEVQKQLISRELVKTHVFGYLDAGNRRLLGDTPKTISRRLYALARSDQPIEEGEKLVREILGSQLKPQKERVSKLLREAG